MPLLDTYAHLDKTDPITFAPSTREIARAVCASNYGAHRLLSSMVHELRARNDTYVEELRTKGVATGNMRSPLADAIEIALSAGLYY